ncbi:hypothetical protein [Natronoglomus mannanivorans]|uniref:Uncharacterized protein n=1 Tax=Natronoglomus mannanivorans TaxID=2979990 RepID=A0AAP2Z350_9EURY|nr:hypothetical protein [Halobacteria archaeon AArc-xg1-1]
MITQETKRRLFHRRRTDETFDDMINRLLDETIVEMTLKETIEAARNEYDDITAISVNHPGLTETGLLYVKIWSPEIMDGGEANVFSPSHRVVIERDGETVRMVPVVIEGMYFPDLADNQDTTTIYLEDLGAKHNPVALAEGIDHLRNKLQHPESWEDEFKSKRFETFLDK